MKGIIDRFETNVAIVELENKEFIHISKDILPHNCKEGDVIFLLRDGKVKIDYIETEKLKKDIDNLIDELFE
ncbi:DUF3006 domain-containing protein [Alkalithermobacter paradoxus]|uniref:Uncharacterized protein n=1 Tax=Alkalithermobacter paradoxus TaxID=29349 RepID=A0A1V4I6J0_9FIRM|nr:hypothetical protein CLOTH_13450 [[Clostridium] thermoalcaliphilum]